MNSQFIQINLQWRHLTFGLYIIVYCFHIQGGKNNLDFCEIYPLAIFSQYFLNAFFKQILQNSYIVIYFFKKDNNFNLTFNQSCFRFYNNEIVIRLHFYQLYVYYSTYKCFFFFFTYKLDLCMFYVYNMS